VGEGAGVEGVSGGGFLVPPTDWGELLQTHDDWNNFLSVT
jgi:hypothetical protein